MAGGGGGEFKKKKSGCGSKRGRVVGRGMSPSQEAFENIDLAIQKNE